jgi:hypothetical protein
VRNKYPGPCYRCKKTVPAGVGHFERSHGKWLLIHAECVFEQRREKQGASMSQHTRDARTMRHNLPGRTDSASQTLPGQTPAQPVKEK